MPLIVTGIRTPVDMGEEEICKEALRKTGLLSSDIVSSGIHKSSVDARRKGHITFVSSVELELANPALEESIVTKYDFVTLRQRRDLTVIKGEKKLSHSPVVVGFGPCGMFAALLLAQNGYNPIVIERGAAIEQRDRAVTDFFEKGILSPYTNIQFGEGGAGSYSDGKLTTRINDENCEWILHELVRFGAPKEILKKAKPHIGTDYLKRIVTAIRKEIETLGGKVCFETTVQSLKIISGRLCGVITDKGEIPCDVAVLAPGHSARDTFRILHNQGLSMESKPFSVGVRIEHNQNDIDHAMYGNIAERGILGPAEYQLSHRSGNRAVYTFCMCPGGQVVAAASGEGQVVTNGMSWFQRDLPNANSALVVSVSAEDFGTRVLDGILFQEKLESAAFSAGGGGYKAPAQTVASFLKGGKQNGFGSIVPSYPIGVKEYSLTDIFPGNITAMLKVGLLQFDKKLCGFAHPDAVLTGVESRTSSPVRILRDAELCAIGTDGLYPAGEGAGYAGGIMSAATDGLRVALKIISKYRLQ